MNTVCVQNFSVRPPKNVNFEHKLIKSNVGAIGALCIWNFGNVGKVKVHLLKLGLSYFFHNILLYVEAIFSTEAYVRTCIWEKIPEAIEIKASRNSDRPIHMYTRGE